MKPFKFILRSTTILAIMLVLAILPFSSAQASSVGPKDPTVGSNVNGIGTQAWTNPGNITSPGSPYTTVTILHGSLYSNYLQGTGYGFSIPTDVTVLGIELTINRMFTGHPNIIDNSVRLVKGGVIVGNNKASAALWPTVFTSATYGGPTDLWGTTWTPAEINAAGFGAVLAVYRDNNGSLSSTVSVDTIQIKVYYAYATATTVLCGNGSSITYGDSVTCVATITRQAGTLTPTGTVAWTSTGSGAFTPNPCSLTGANGTATCSATYTPSAVGSGSHTLTATYSGDDFFSSSNASQAVTVLTRPVTVTADPKTKVFGSSDPLLTYQVTTGSLVFNDAFTGALARDPGENVGPYNITQGSLALPASYDLTFVGSTFTITKADPTCTVTPYNLTYDATEHLATGSCSGVLAEPLTGLDLTATAHTNAGDFTDAWTFTDSTGNYNNTSGSVNDVIAQATATCSVTAYDVTFDGNPHSADGACTGLNAVPLDGLDLSATTHTNAGTYLADAWSFTNPNYLTQNGTVDDHIAKADASCQVNGYSLEFDRNAHTATGACTGVKGENLLGLDLSATTHTVVGTYANDPWSFTDQTGNYNNTSGTVNDQVTKRLITVTADPKTKNAGKPDPVLTYQVTAGALLSGDSFSGSLTRQPGEVAGTYAILQGSLSLPNYYQITFVSANFTITGGRILLPLIIK